MFVSSVCVGRCRQARRHFKYLFMQICWHYWPPAQRKWNAVASHWLRLSDSSDEPPEKGKLNKHENCAHTCERVNDDCTPYGYMIGFNEENWKIKIRSTRRNIGEESSVSSSEFNANCNICMFSENEMESHNHCSTANAIKDRYFFLVFVACFMHKKKFVTCWLWSAWLRRP